MSVIDSALLDEWYAVARSEDCVPGALLEATLFERRLVIWRGEGEGATVEAWLDRCPHRGVPLSLGRVTGDTLTCMYHGWVFEQDGRCSSIPAQPDRPRPTTACARRFQCCEKWGLIWVSLGKAPAAMPSFPEAEDPAFETVVYGPYVCAASPFRVMENAFDYSHVAFMHRDSIGGGDPRVPPYEAVLEADGLHIGQYSVRSTDAGPGGGRDVDASYVIHVCRPHLAYYNKTVPAGRNAQIFTASPVSEFDCRVWGVAAMDHAFDAEAFRHFQDRVWSEDVVAVESQWPKPLPLLPRRSDEPPHEVHLKADIASVEYRRWLKALGITFGVC